MRARALVAPGAVLALALAIGCGGAGGRGAGNRGRATLRVSWPTAAARLIPASSQSLVVTVSQGATAVGTLVIRRPQASGALTGLPYGTLNVTVKAYATPNGSGVAQALGLGTMAVTEDVPGTVAVNLDSTVASLSLSSGAGTISKGGSANLTASAKDRDGAIVPLAVAGASESLTWDVQPAGLASVSGSGASVALTGVASGDVAVTATLKVKDAGDMVTSSPLSVHIADAVVAAGLPSGAYPVSGRDYGGSGATTAPSLSSGTVVDTISAGSGTTKAVVGPDGTLYAAGTGILLAKGAVNWTLSGGGEATGLLLTASGTLLVGRRSGLEARDAVTQRLSWIAPATSAPAVGRDGTVFAFDATKLYAYDGANGNVLWSRTASLADRLAVGDDGTVYGHKGAVVTAFDPATGATRWSVTVLGDTAGSAPVVVGDTVYVKTGKNSTSSGSRSEPILSDMSEPESRGVTSATTSGTSSIGSTTVTNSTTSGFPSFRTYYTHVNVTALRATDGGQRWSYAYPVTMGTYSASVPLPPLTNVGGAIAIRNDRVLSLWRSSFTMLDSSGGKVWSVSGNVSSSPTFAGDGTGYLADAAGNLRALDPATGASRWTLLLVPLNVLSTDGPIVAEDGTIYVTTISGKVFQVR